MMKKTSKDKVVLTKADKLDQIRMLGRLLEGLAGEEAELGSLLAENPEKLAEISLALIPAGQFYLLDFKTHAILLFYLAGLMGELKEFAVDPSSVEKYLTQGPPELPAWLSQDDGEIRAAQFFACFYTLSRTISCIRHTGRTINELLEAGMSGDLAMLKLAVKIDPVTLS